MTVVVPTDIEEALRTEQFRTRTPISKLIKSILAERYGLDRKDFDSSKPGSKSANAN
jgi:hypothetical protein